MRTGEKLVLAGVGLAAGYGLLRHFRKPTVAVSPASSTPGTDSPHGPTTGDWVNPNAPNEIRAIAAPLEQLAHWPNLGNYLAAISYIESRGNNEAGSSENNNKARGWFGGRPESMNTAEYGFVSPNILKDKIASVVLAADYAKRLRPYGDEGQVLDWLAIRRGWAKPSLVNDVNDPGFSEQLATGLEKVGLPREFMFLPAFPDDFEWPGFDAAYAALKVA